MKEWVGRLQDKRKEVLECQSTQNKGRNLDTHVLSIYPELTKSPWCFCSLNANILPVAYPLFLMFGTCAVYLFISCLLMRYLGSFSFQQK